MMMSVVEYEKQSKQHHPIWHRGQVIKELIISECETSSLISAKSLLNILRALNPFNLSRKRTLQCNPETSMATV